MALRSPRRRTGCLSLVALLIVLSSLLYFFRDTLLTNAGSALVEDDGPHHADAALVLGGDQFVTRILKASQLAKAGYVPIIFVSGPNTYGGYESDFTIEYAVQHGYPASLYEPVRSKADSTIDESSLFGPLFRARGIHTVIIVTSNFHTRRAARILRSRNPDLTFYVVAAPDPYFTPSGWWKSRPGQKIFLLEWTKTIAAVGGL